MSQELDDSGDPVGEEELWDLHRPFQRDARLRFQLYSSSADWAFAHQLNKAYWRSSSFVLGAILESAFKVEGVVLENGSWQGSLQERFPVRLHSWPGTDYRAGSFVCDVAIEGLRDWTPSPEELHILGRTMMAQLRDAALPIEPLVMSKTTALQLFADNPFKTAAIQVQISPTHSSLIFRLHPERGGRHLTRHGTGHHSRHLPSASLPHGIVGPGNSASGRPFRLRPSVPNGEPRGSLGRPNDPGQLALREPGRDEDGGVGVAGVGSALARAGSVGPGCAAHLGLRLGSSGAGGEATKSDASSIRHLPHPAAVQRRNL